MKLPETSASLRAPVTICLLCYGNHPELAQRILSSLHAHTNAGSFRLRVGMNAICAETKAIIDRFLPLFQTELTVRSEVNIYKAAMMRRLFHDQPIRTDWTLWFDDDSFVFRSDWLPVLSCESRLRPHVDMWGLRLSISTGESHRRFIQAAPWYKGLELANAEGDGKYRLSFIAGGFWAIRTEWLYQLNWPERRLVHFGDDYLLGEALRQNGGKIGPATSGVAINRAARRAPQNTPLCEVLN